MLTFFAVIDFLTDARASSRLRAFTHEHLVQEKNSLAGAKRAAVGARRSISRTVTEYHSLYLKLSFLIRTRFCADQRIRATFCPGCRPISRTPLLAPLATRREPI